MNRKGAENLGKALSNNKSLQVLNISSNEIDDEGMKGLFANIGVVFFRVLGIE
jgi:Leucine Rich repeat